MKSVLKSSALFQGCSHLPFFLFLFSVVGGFFPANLLAESFLLKIETQVDRSEITIGDQIQYTLKITYPKTGELNLPSILGNLGAFEVKNYKEHDPITEKESRIKTYTFTLSTFTVGEYTIPPQVVEYFPGTDTSRYTSYSEPLKILVKRSTPESTKDIAEISDVLAPPFQYTKVLLWIGLLLLLGILLFLYIKKRSQKPSLTITPLLPPFEEALKGLQELQLAPTDTLEDQKFFCLRLSELVRRYISRRFELSVMESTTDEFLKKIKSLPISPSIHIKMQEFCNQTDPVKFANQPLVTSVRQTTLDFVESFLTETRPIPAPSATNQQDGQK